MVMTTISTAAHTAVLEPWTGQGLLLLARVERDMELPPTPVELVIDGAPVAGLAQAGGLHEADFTAAMRALDRQGWGLLEDEDGSPLVEGVTVDGREALVLYSDPLDSNDDMAVIAAGMRELREAAGLDPVAV